jgi:hypothetical protein
MGEQKENRMRTEDDMIEDGWMRVGSPVYSANLRDGMIDSLKDITADDMEIIIKHIDNRLLQSKPPTVDGGPDLQEYLNRGDR